MTDHLHALPSGHRLNQYRIERVLGDGGFGITYYAIDTNLDKPVVIKEYLPSDFALRTNATTVHPQSDTDRDYYQWGLERFLGAAQALARFEHPHLNKVYSFFEGNGTAYIVLAYIEGETLAQVLQRDNRLEAPRLRRLLDELLSGLEAVHGAGYVHRNIEPDNIMLHPDGAVVLLGFNDALRAMKQRAVITQIWLAPYEPLEQYDLQAKYVGPWSDLYALGMVAYRCITGLGYGDIPDAGTRSRLEHKEKFSLVPAVEAGKGQYEESLLQAVDWAIRLDEEQRPRSVAELREMLAGGIPEEARKEHKAEE